MLGHQSPYAFAAALTGRPLAMSPEAAASAYEIFSAMEMRALGSDERAATSKPYELDARGVATIRIHDQMVNHATRLSDFLGLTAYDQLRRALSAAGADPAVRGVLLEIDSPGGDVAGATETAAAVRALAARKPVAALIDSMAMSAAYIIAAGAPRIFVTPSATVGSIGVVYVHLDRSAAMAKSGVKPTIICAGRFKGDGNSMGPLPDDARGRLQALIGAAHDLILSSVGQHRPALGAAGARKTEAGVYMGTAAVAAGLADAVGDVETARAYLFSPRPSLPPPAASRALPPSPTIGVKPMPIAASSEPSRVIAALVSAPYRFSAAAVTKAIKKEESRLKANAEVVRQMGAQSDSDRWRETATRVSSQAAGARRTAPTEAAKPAATKTSDDMWREVIEKQGRPSALREVYR